MPAGVLGVLVTMQMVMPTGVLGVLVTMPNFAAMPSDEREKQQKTRNE